MRGNWLIDWSRTLYWFLQQLFFYCISLLLPVCYALAARNCTLLSFHRRKSRFRFARLSLFAECGKMSRSVVRSKVACSRPNLYQTGLSHSLAQQCNNTSSTHIVQCRHSCRCCTVIKKLQPFRYAAQIRADCSPQGYGSLRLTTNVLNGMELIQYYIISRKFTLGITLLEYLIKRRSISMYKQDVHYDFVLVNMTNNRGIITFT